MSAISADYEDLLLGKPDQLDTRAADLVTAADAIEQATAALRGLIDDQTSLSTDALAETASEVARSLSKARTRYRKLMARGIALRRCDTFPGLGWNYFRLAVRKKPQVDSLITALKE